MTHADHLPHHLKRTVDILAPADTVFRFFTDSARWAAWWGAGSVIDPRPGGHVLIRYPNGIEVTGEVLAIEEPRRLVFTYGYAKGVPIAPGSSIVTMQLEPQGNATRVHLTHSFAEASHREQHEQGWRHQLSLFINAVANEQFANAAEAVDGWFAAWSDTDQGSRDAALRRLTAPTVHMRDQFSAIAGHEDLLAHVAAAQRFMPGVRMERSGAVHHCQGMVVADWTAKNPAGEVLAKGMNVFTFDAGRTIQSVTGFWNVR